MTDPEPSPSRRGRAVARALLLVASLALVAGGAELAARLWAAEPWWDRIVEAQQPEQLERFPVGSMNLPLRQAPEAGPKPAGRQRVLFLGDSFTYGLGVAEPDTFVARVGAGLGEGVETYNGGVPGSLTDAWRALYATFAPAFDPDVVVAVFFLRDGVAGIETQDQIVRIADAMRGLEERSALFRRSHFYRLLRGRWEQRKLSERYLGLLAGGYLGPRERTVEWWRARTNLLWIQDQARQRGARFGLVIFPVLFALGADYPLREVCDEIERFAREHDMPVLSLLPAFLGEGASSLWVSPLDQHPNERAHAIAAEAMAPFVATLARAEPR